MSRNQHVVPYGGEWAVRTAGNTRVSSVYRNQKDAVIAARKEAHSRSSEVIIHGKSGRVCDRNNKNEGMFIRKLRYSF